MIGIGICFSASSQSACTVAGQTPQTAFPVCGTSVFEQAEVPICGHSEIFVPGCTGSSNAVYTDKNPFWYKFTCFRSGTLGFEIVPKDLSDDYDWQLFDITGHNPADVYSNRNLVVTGNWAGNSGSTGTSAGGAPFVQCASLPEGSEPRFARMPNLVEGHEYLLLVSHFSDNQSGYDLSFSGGTAVITDYLIPAMQSLDHTCDAATIFVKTNKRVKCSSIAADGSDFHIPGSGVNVIAAAPFCAGFDTDSIQLMLDRPLIPGEYEVWVKEGSDGNTVLDNCDNYIPEGDNLRLSIPVLEPAKLDSLQTVECAPRELSVVFEKRIVCSTVDPGGSNFVVTGPYPVTVTGATMVCDANGLSNTIRVQLAEPLVHEGNYRIILKTGVGSETPVDECGLTTLPGMFLDLFVKDTVNADFSFNIARTCDQAYIQFIHDGAHGVTDWTWQLEQNGESTAQNPSGIYPPFGDKTITLTVSNGFCNDVVSRTVPLGPHLLANFEADNILCPEDTLHLINNSTGNINSYTWSFGDGTNSADPVPINKMYAQQATETRLPITLTIKDNAGCSSSFSSEVRLLVSCYIAVPNAFTPNGDKLNDYLYPLNAYKADNLIFRVYNRYGQKVFETTDWEKKWDGNVNGQPQSSGTYAWTLEYTHRDTGEHYNLKGTATLIR